MNSDLKTEKPGYAQTLSVVQYDEKNRPAYAIGIVEDITKSHEMEMALDYARSRDALTGLYTRETGLRDDPADYGYQAGGSGLCADDSGYG